MDKLMENNQVTIAGTIASDFKFSHETYGEKFYSVDVGVARFSGTVDMIPVMVSGGMMNTETSRIGEKIRVSGQFRSFNRHDNDKNRIVLSVFAHEIEFLDEMQSSLDCNEILLDGYICKVPIYRKTPLGREICDFLIAANRSYGKSDYIPCITWGRNALYTSGLYVGSRVKLYGRIQSREYTKNLSDTETETRTAYEVSVSKIELVEENL